MNDAAEESQPDLPQEPSPTPVEPAKPDGPGTPGIPGPAKQAPMPSAAAREKPGPLLISSVLGVVETLNPLERARFMACEDVVGGGWTTFVQVGMALGTIRDQRLYREEFDTFEDYCQRRWEYGRRYANQLISAAQVVAHLGAPGSQKPEHEKQIRPLIGLAPEQADAAWQRAVALARGKKVTSRHVKAAVKELHFQPAARPEEEKRQRAKSQRRQMVSDAMNELLELIKGNQTHQVLLEKAQVLQWRIQTLVSSKNATAK